MYLNVIPHRYENAVTYQHYCYPEKSKTETKERNKKPIPHQRRRLGNGNFILAYSGVTGEDSHQCTTDDAQGTNNSPQIGPHSTLPVGVFG